MHADPKALLRRQGLWELLHEFVLELLGAAAVCR